MCRPGTGRRGLCSRPSLAWREPERLACRFTVGFWSAYLKFVGGLLCIDNTPPSTNGSALGEVASIRDRVGVDDFDPVAGSIRLTEPCGDFPPGGFDGGEEGSPEGEVGRGRCGEGAAGSVQGLRVPPPAKSPHPAAVIEDVDQRPFRVTPFDEDRLGPEAEDGACGGLHRFDIRDPRAGQPLRFEPVRGHERGEAEQMVHEGVPEVVLLEARPDRRHHDRVHDEGECGAPKLPRDGPNDFRGEEHPGLRRPDIEVPEDGAELLPDFRDRDREDRVDGACVLGRHARDHGRPMHPDRGEGLQVGLDSGTAPRVAPGDRQGGPHGRAMEGAGLRLTRTTPWAAPSGTALNSASLFGTETMRARSGHIKFDKKVKWKNLVSSFRPLFLKFLEETQQLPEDMESVDVLIEENLRDLRNNRKPEGYNREGLMRMIFPISNQVEFYVYGRGKTIEVARVTEQLSRILQKYRLKHTIEWDRLKVLADKKDA